MGNVAPPSGSMVARRFLRVQPRRSRRGSFYEELYPFGSAGTEALFTCYAVSHLEVRT